MNINLISTALRPSQTAVVHANDDGTYTILVNSNKSKQKQIYQNYKLRTYALRYSVNQFREAKEFIFSSPITKLKSYDKVKLSK